jgi:hypothetical protein
LAQPAAVCSSCSDACGNQLEVAGEIWAVIAGEDHYLLYYQ